MVNYWTGSTSTATPTGADCWDTTGGTATTADFDCWYTVTSTTRTVRKLLVRTPKNWSKRDLDAFINLVNKHTNTGWKVDMVISGDVEIVDHDIEVVSMMSFSEILAAKATESDREKIHDFFTEKKLD